MALWIIPALAFTVLVLSAYLWKRGDESRVVVGSLSVVVTVVMLLLGLVVVAGFVFFLTAVAGFADVWTK